MESAAIVLAVVGGYIFSSKFRITQLRIAQATGYELAFLSILTAFVFFQISCLVLYAVYSETWTFEGFLSLWRHPIQNRLDRAIPRDLLGSLLLFENKLIPPCLLSLAMGALLWRPANWLLRFWRTDIELLERQVARHGSELDKLLFSAVATGRQVQITLDTGKVYAGAVVQLPKLKRTDRDPSLGLTLVVSRSGYRDQKTHKLCFTTPYEWLHTPSNPVVNLGTLETFIPLHRIVSASFFNAAVYEHFQKQPSPDPQPWVHVPFKHRRRWGTPDH